MPIIVKKAHLKQRAAAGVIIKTLHEAKQELAEELEVNLKQLKAVLETTQRIARELEAVLKEAKAEPDRDDATGKPRPSWEVAERQAAWKPPGVKEAGVPERGGGEAKREGEPKPWYPPSLKHGNFEEAEPEPWLVPVEAKRENHTSH